MSMPAFGVIFHPTFPPEILGEYARRAETAAFDELWLWDDCFLPGALTSAAIALAATRTLKVGIGLLPATAYNPLFAAMEITTLARVSGEDPARLWTWRWDLDGPDWRSTEIVSEGIGGNGKSPAPALKR